MRSTLSLHFYGSPAELYKVEYLKEGLNLRRSIRGLSHPSENCSGSFKWSSAVRALSALILRTVCKHSGSVEGVEPSIHGESLSLASSLDYALSKEPAWMIEMFGSDLTGRCFLRKLIYRTNPERKYPGPVILTLNKNCLHPDSIRIFWNSQVVDQGEHFHHLLNDVEGKKCSEQVSLTSLPTAFVDSIASTESKEVL